MRLALFIDGEVGKRIAQILRDKDVLVELLVLNHKASGEYKNNIKSMLKYKKLIEYDYLIENFDRIKDDISIDIGILCWWPFIVKSNLLECATRGFLNFHPSFLPFGRGKHPNFWTFVDNTPFGVSIHWVNDSIDGGAIAFQEEIVKKWTDTGGSLYAKALDVIVNLFCLNLDKILSGDIPCIPQDNTHIVRYAKELEAASYIDLNRHYSGSELINMLRARTFSGYPGCWFEADNKRYEIKVIIEEI